MLLKNDMFSTSDKTEAFFNSVKSKSINARSKNAPPPSIIIILISK